VQVPFPKLQRAVASPLSATDLSRVGRCYREIHRGSRVSMARIGVDSLTGSMVLTDLSS